MYTSWLSSLYQPWPLDSSKTTQDPPKQGWDPRCVEGNFLPEHLFETSSLQRIYREIYKIFWSIFCKQLYRSEAPGEWRGRGGLQGRTGGATGGLAPQKNLEYLQLKMTHLQLKNEYLPENLQRLIRAFSVNFLSTFELKMKFYQGIFGKLLSSKSLTFTEYLQRPIKAFSVNFLSTFELKMINLGIYRILLRHFL